jgi:DNA repair ATPase RecN
VAKLRERISVSKQARQKFDLERFDLKKLDDIEVKEKYQVEISNRFAVLESLDESFDISNAWESIIRESIKKQEKGLKAKINVLETNNKNKNIRDLYRGINEFKKGYQPRSNVIKDEIGDLLADPQSVLSRWKNFFNQVLNVHGVHDVRQMDIHRVEPLVPEPSLVEVEIAIEKL